MKTTIHPATPLKGSYDVQRLPAVALGGTNTALPGVVRIAAGIRSPAEGLRANARHEIAIVLEGEVRVDTADRSWIARKHDTIVSSPTEPHSTTALTDATLFFVLLDPVTT